MKLKALGAALGLALGMAATNASALSLYTSPSYSNFEDDNIDYLSYDANGNGLLDIGDRLTALVDYNSLIELSSTFSPTGNITSLNELTGITEIQVTNVTGLGGGSFRIDFGPSATFEATYGTGAMLALYNDPGGTLNISSSCASVAGCQAEATDGALWAVFGLDANDGDTSWFSVGSNNVALATTLLPSSKVATVNYALNILTNNTGYALDRVLPCEAVVGFSCAGDGFVDMVGSADILGGLGLDPGHVRSDSDFMISANRVPEPGTVALLGLALSGLAYSRRKS